MNMEGIYPIIIHGQEQGQLEVATEGLHTVFRGVCADTGELLRLSLYGEREGYLGVMAPEEGRLHLTRRLSRSALRGFPQCPTHAGPAGETIAPPAAEATAAEEAPAPEAAPVLEEMPPAPPDQEIQVLHLAELHSDHAVDITNDVLWYAAPGGCLYSAGDGGRFLAVPESRSQSLPDSTGVKRRIQGKNYLIFKTGIGGRNKG